MVLNRQVPQSEIDFTFLQFTDTKLSQLLKYLDDNKRTLLRIQLLITFFWGSFYLQGALAQGVNPNAALFMQGLGETNPATINSNSAQSPISATSPKSPLLDIFESNTSQPKKTKDQEAIIAKNKEPIPLNTFQTYLLQTIGKSFPIYGQKLFQLDNPYATIETTSIPIDYVLGPGDELQVKIYSSAIDLDQRFVINRDGMIVLPKLGPLSLAGVSVGNIEIHLKKKLSQSLTDFNLYVSMGQLRGIEVYLTGQAKIPGKHNLSSVSTLISALFVTGGPASNGSMREIQLIRSGKQVAFIDLYEFIQKGNKSTDVRLLPGDVIHIPPIGPQVVLKGTIPNQAIFELSTQKSSSIGDLLNIGGGLTAFTNTFEAYLERVDTKKSPALSVESIRLNAEGLKTTLRDGDILDFQAVKPNFSNAISIRFPNSPVKRIPIPIENARVTDVIPSKESLLTAEYFYRRSNFGIDQISTATNDALPPLLRSPSTPPTSTPPTSTPPTSTPPPSTLLYAPPSTLLNNDFDRIRENSLLDQVNFQSVMVERIEANTLKSQVITFNLERAIANPKSNDNIQLFPGDTITILNQKDLPAPLERQMRVVRLLGEVNSPGIYQLNGSETLRDLIKKAGGFTSNAYLYGTEFTRQSIKDTQKKNLEIVVKRLEDQESLELRQSAGNLVFETTSLAALRAQNQVRLKERLTILRNAIPTGRLALELDPKRTQLPDLSLENGDSVLIPSKPSNVSIIGAVYNENALLHIPGKTVGDYLRSVGITQNAERDSLFVVRADGTLLTSDFDSLLFKSKIEKADLYPGDTIVVPEKTIREGGYSVFMRGLKDWTQVLFQLGLGVAAIKVLK